MILHTGKGVINKMFNDIRLKINHSPSTQQALNVNGHLIKEEKGSPPLDIKILALFKIENHDCLPYFIKFLKLSVRTKQTQTS